MLRYENVPPLHAVVLFFVLYFSASLFTTTQRGKEFLVCSERLCVCVFAGWRHLPTEPCLPALASETSRKGGKYTTEKVVLPTSPPAPIRFSTQAITFRLTPLKWGAEGVSGGRRGYSKQKYTHFHILFSHHHHHCHSYACFVCCCWQKGNRAGSLLLSGCCV